MTLLGGWESTAMERDRAGNPRKPKNYMFLFLGKLKYPVGSTLGRLGVALPTQCCNLNPLLTNSYNFLLIYVLSNATQPASLCLLVSLQFFFPESSLSLGVPPNLFLAIFHSDFYNTNTFSHSAQISHNIPSSSREQRLLIYLPMG